MGIDNALSGTLNEYHAEDIVERASAYVTDGFMSFSGSVGGLEKCQAERLVRRLVRSAGKGKLTSNDAVMLTDRRMAWGVRELYTSSVSWAIYTVEYMDSLARLAQSIAGKDRPKVLEVCAGRGVLSRPMTERGIDWECTDARPVTENVQRADALKAIGESDADILFVSWVPYGSSLDTEMAKKWCVEMGKPMIIVGERQGCTGSEAFWGSYNGDGDYEEIELQYSIRWASDEVDDFTDVSQWDGIRDYTAVAAPINNVDKRANAT